MIEILATLVALLHWRLVLSTLGSIVMAVVLSKLITPFTAAYCLAMVIFGIVFGVVWQARTGSGARTTSSTRWH